MSKISRESNILRALRGSLWLTQKFNGSPIYQLGTGGASILGRSNQLSKQFVGENYKHFVICANLSELAFLYDSNDLKRVGESYYKKHRSVKSLKKWISRYDKTYEKKLTSTLKGRKKLSDLSTKDLIQRARENLDLLDASTGFSHTIEAIATVSEKKLIVLLDKRASNSPEYLHLLSAPLKTTYITEVQLILGNIRGTKDKKLRNQKINQFLKKFWWIESSYAEGKTLDNHGLRRVTQKMGKINIPADLKLLVRRKKALTKSLGLTPDEQFVADTLSEIAVWQDNRKMNILKTISQLEQIFNELSSKTQIRKEVLKFLCPHEVRYSNLTNKDFIFNLNKRYPIAVYYVHNGRVDVVVGRTAQAIKDKIFKKKASRKNIIRGLPANRGKTKGRVVRIFTVSDLPKLKKGNILVASMTRPEFISAMKKAAAFVTDEGGITSHAAIVAREMRKPCIIGTKIATQVLKDGDVVEVDATRGIVKKL